MSENLHHVNMTRLVIVPLALLSFGGLSCADSLPPGAGGAVIWSVPGSSAGTAATDDARVYFLGNSNEVIAVDKRNGARRWAAPTGTSGGTFGGGVRVVGDLVVAGDGGLVAFDRVTGARRWTFRPVVGGLPGLYDFSSDGTRIFAGSNSGHVHAIDLSGRVAWLVDLMDQDSVGVAAYSPVHSEGHVYVCFNRFGNPTTGGIVVLSATTGQVSWRVEFPPRPPNNAAGCLGKVVIVDDLVVGATQDGNIHAYGRFDGVHAWSAPQVTGLEPSGVGNALMDSRPLAAGPGVVVAGSTTTWVLGFDARTGEELWRSSSRRGSVFYPIAADHGAAYVTGSGDELSSYDLRTGALRWRLLHDYNDPFAAPPLIDGERVYIGTDKKLMAVRR